MSQVGLAEVLPRLTDSEKASLRSQSGQGLRQLSQQSLPALCSASAPSCSACCCSALSASPFLQCLASADVAVHSSPVATIVQDAAELECWEGEVSPSRVPEQGSVAKQELESRRTFSCEIWTWPHGSARRGGATTDGAALVASLARRPRTRAGGTTKPNQIGGFGHQGRWQMVSGNSNIPEVVGGSQSSQRTHPSPETR